MSDQNEIIDALVYSEITNIISPTQFQNRSGEYWNRIVDEEQSQTTANQLDKNTSTEDAYTNFIKKLFGDKQTHINSEFKDLLSQSTIKRACCMGYNSDDGDTNNYEISVKLPFNYDLADKMGATQDTIKKWQKLGFINKPILVPKSLCPTGYSRPAQEDKNESICDRFMRAYCENVKEMYNSYIINVGGKYDENEYMNMSPECGCYADRLKEYGGNAPPLCYSPRCNFSKTVYTDQNSRVQGGCPVQQCVTILNLGTSASLGGTAKIDTQSKQSCFSPETQQKYGLPSVPAPSNLTPPSNTLAPNKKELKPNIPTKPNTPTTPPKAPDSSGNPSDASKNANSGEIISGLSNGAFYGIVGGIGGLILIIIIVVAIIYYKSEYSKRTKAMRKLRKNNK